MDDIIKYKEIIDKVFLKFNMSPRHKQMYIIDKILKEYIDKGKKIVVLSAPTGSGKSIIAAIIAESLWELSNKKIQYQNKKAFYMMHTNTLTKQYQDTFQFSDFLNIMGASNYDCKIIGETAEDCISKRHAYNNNQESKIPIKCKICPYLMSRKNMNTTPHLILNYSLFFSYNLYMKKLHRRLLSIYDEAHIINEIFCNHISIVMSDRILNSIISIINKENNNRNVKLNKSIEKLQYFVKDIIPNITLDNYKDKLNIVYSELYSIAKYYEEEANTCLSVNDIIGYKSKNKISNKLDNLYSKFADFESNKYEFVVDIKDNRIQIQPIFVRDSFKRFDNSEYSLFMSATITKEFIHETLNVDPNEVSFIKIDSVFPPEHKNIVFLNHNNYNYRNMNDIKNLNDMCTLILEILKNHYDEKGIILTPSFKINDIIYNYIYKNIQNKNYKLFNQKPGENLSDIVNKFKDYKFPSLLLSPSMFEGLDMPYDHSRFQIMVKAPYQSLDNKRTKYILENHSDIYEIQTIYKIIQGFGRSTRNIDDHSTTYCLDYNIFKLFQSHNNIWIDEFKTTIL